MAKKNLLCIFGGKSTEYEVSLRSVCMALEALDPEKYHIITLGITKEGVWYLYSGTQEDILNNTWHQKKECLRRAILSPNFGEHVLYVETAEAGHFATLPVDVILPMVHGAYAEDGNLQGLLSMSGIPYVGSHCTASSVSMDKTMTKLILNNYHIPQAKSACLTRAQIMEDMERALDIAEAVDAYPLFIKPACEGSSIGVSKVFDRTSLQNALQTAAKYGKKILVEEYIIGREIECAVLGNDAPRATVPGEICSGVEFYDYDAKYITDTSSDYIPARINQETMEKIRTYAVQIYQILGCQGLSRVDFFVQDNGRIIFNEINTLPGFTSISMYPKLWAYMGTCAGTLFDTLIALAEACEDR